MKLENALARLIAVGLFVSLAPMEAAASSPLSGADFRRIDSYIETQLKEADIPGAALVIVEGNQITHLQGYGIAGPDGRPVTPETAFFLGSVSKSFTALAVMQLVESGQIDLDAPVQEYLPWFRVADSEASRQMKVKHFLNHTSGFSTYDGRTHFTSTDMSAEAIERRVRALCDARTTAPVGKGFCYSNANYCVLGAIIESVSGQSYEDYIRDNVFTPLNMSHSYTSETAAAQHDLATGYRYWFGRSQPATHIPRSRGDLPAAHLISCAKDMGSYLIAHMNGGAFGDLRILSEEGVSRLHTPESKNLNYAMGWYVKTIDKTRAVSHSGTLADFHAGMTIFPEEQTGLVLLVNAHSFVSGPKVRSLVDMTELHMLDMFVLPVAKSPRVHLGVAMLVLLLLGQVIGLIPSCRQAYRRWRLRDARPRGMQQPQLMRIGSFVLLEIGAAVTMFWLVPWYHDSTLPCLMLFAPDAGWLLLVNGVLAVIVLIVSLTRAVFLVWQSESATDSRATNPQPLRANHPVHESDEFEL